MMTDKNAIISSYGLDISSTSIKWEGWTPNKKYSDKIIISNLNTKTVNIKIKSLPKSKYFEINDNNNNNIIKIRGGHSKKLLINFLPLEIKNYFDEIILSIITNNNVEDIKQIKQISILLNADIPKTSLQIPSIIDFGFIAVKEESNLQFEIINNGDTSINFQWITNKSPLIFEPEKGIIIGNKSQIINIQYTPQNASCVEMKVPMEIYNDNNNNNNNNNNDKIKEIMYMTVRAMCTYPFFKISTKMVNMGAISIGECKKKKLKIENCSSVSSVITIKNGNNMEDNMDLSVFSINPTKCKIESNSFIEIEIEFKPRTVGIKYTKHCIIDTLCGYKVNFEISGKADSPKIASSLNLINFKSVEINKSLKKTFILKNYSMIDSYFEFINVGESEKNKSSFIVIPKRGKILSSQSIIITVLFKPNNAMLYNKKIYCIIHHHIPLFIQLIGCGFDDKTKFILLPQFDKLQNEININEINKEQQSQFDKLENINHTNMSHILFTELFNINHDIKSSTNIIQFESCSLSQGIAPYHDITLFNKNKTNLISIKWDVESSKISKSVSSVINIKKNEFAVFPPFMDIRSLSSADFSAAFQPSQDLMYFYDKIDCYYHHKLSINNDSNSKLQLNCISIDLFGDSFVKSSNHFPSNIKLSTDRIEFTPCSLGSSIYATIKIKNLSTEHPTIWKIDISTNYNFNSPLKQIENEENEEKNEEKQQEKQVDADNNNNDDISSKMFSFNPIQGYIAPNSFQIIVARFEPLKQGTTTFNTNIIFNDKGNKDNIKSLQLIGIAVEPKLNINNEIYVIPTCIGMSSIEYIELYNSSPIPIYYQWQIPLKYLNGDIISIQPLKGILNINEKTKSILKFSPNIISEKYIIECKCYYSTKINDDIENMEYYERLTINACCNQSIVEFIPKQSDFGSILIDSQTTKSVAIQNNADCKLNCDFYIEPQNDEISPFINNCDIPPKTRKQLQLNINAIYRGYHEYKLIAKVKRIDGKGSITSYSIIKFNAIWPTLSIVDIQCDDMLLSKENLWSKFNLNLLNKTFKSDLTKFERNWNNVHIEKQNIMNNNNLNNILNDKFINIDFKFGTKQLKYKENTKIYINIYNKSSISAFINFKYLRELLCKPENWVNHNNNNDDNDHYDDYLLFDVKPKHFELEPNKSTIISFTYYHKICGQHQTKILLSIQNGKQITLNLFGETITSNYHPKLSILSKNIYLKSQQIGLLNKQILTQFIPINNLSNFDLFYSVDTTSINKINKNNYDFKIFQILNLQGIIKKKSTINLKIKFHPIQIKKYSFNLTINAEINDQQIENPEATFINIPIIANGINYYNDDIKNINDTNFICFGRSYDIKNIIKIPNCYVRLSTEILNFGIIPLRANARKIVMIHNEQNDYSVHFHWQNLIPYVTVKEMNGEIQPNSCRVCEICIRSEIEPSEINDSICCLMWNNQNQWRLYLKIDCSIMTDSQIENIENTNNSNMIIERDLIQTDKPILINTSLLSPKNQKQMNKMRNEAEEISIECCKSLILNALNSKIVQNELNNLSSYQIPVAMDMNNDKINNDNKNIMTWQQLKEEMNNDWDKQKKLLKQTEFHDFLEYVISETVFNITAEMVENFDVKNDKILSNIDNEQ